MNYSATTHTLQFSTDFKSILVLNDSGQQIATYSLTTVSKAIQVEYVSGDYQVLEVDRPGTTTNSIDAGRDPELTFEYATLGGIVVIDLRDMGRAENPPGQYEVAYDLSNEAIAFWYVDGPWQLRLHFNDAQTLTVG